MNEVGKRERHIARLVDEPRAIEDRAGLILDLAHAADLVGAGQADVVGVDRLVHRVGLSLAPIAALDEDRVLTLDRLQGLGFAMAATPETGFLVIADLTGYTAYLSGSELEHAPVIAGDLLETIVGRLEPPFRLAKFEGDAAFLFVEDGRADGSLLLDAIEASYLAFRRRLRSIDQATTCDCNSCRLAPRLDLKVFVHHGEFVRSRIAGRDELAGSDVILVHRLLKGAGAARSPRHTASRCSRRRRSSARARPGRARPDGRQRSRSSTSARSTRSPSISRHAGRPRPASDAWTSRRRTLPSTSRRPLAAEPSVVWAHLTSPALRTAMGRPDPHRGDVGRRTPRRGHDDPVRDRPAGDARGDRRLAALRPRRLAAGGAGRRSGGGHRDLDADRRRHPAPASLGLPGRSAPADEDAVEQLRVDKEAAYARLATIIAGALPVVEQQEARS